MKKSGVGFFVWFPGSRIVLNLVVWLAFGITFPLVSYAQNLPLTTGTQLQTQQTAILDDFNVALQPWEGDYDGMVKRRMIRIVVPYSRTHFFLDGAAKRGIYAAMGRQLEKAVNQRERLRTRLVHVVFIPVPQNQLIPYLTAGLGDIAMGSITITESRRKVVDFSIPFIRNSEEIVVAGPGAPDLALIEDLAGKEVSVQTKSSYHRSLEQLNKSFQEKGLQKVIIDAVNELLEPDEILELVHAGLLPMTVTDRYLAEFWGQIFPNLTVHTDFVIAERDIAWAFRKGSPKLRDVLNNFLRAHRPRTEFGNITLRRYMQNTTWVLNETTTRDRERYDRAIPLFRKYGEMYNIDPLLLAALSYQESRLDQNARSPSGAIGVMQLLPRTGASMNVGDITKIEPNIHAGTRYLRSLIDNVASPAVDRVNTIFLALASYNAGRTRIQRLRRETEQKGLDPKVWLHNVELAVASEIGRETVQYVRNIYRYYLTFRRIEAKRALRGERSVDR